MPQLTVRGITPVVMAGISEALVAEMAAICGCGADNFTIDCLNAVSVFGGGEVQTYPFIEVAWFERGREARDKLADAIARHLRGAGVPEAEIAFKVYAEEGYYINGASCGD